MIWLLVLLLLAGLSQGFVVEKQSVAGENPVLYGDLVAYIREGQIHVFDFPRNDDFTIGKGANPSLFGFNLAFEDAGIIKYLNVRDREIVEVGQGIFPSIYADKIVFSVKESQLGVDVSNDSDRTDDVIQEYNVKSGETKSLDAVGKYPVTNQRYIVFVTEESQVGIDLNSDGDQNDGVVRIFDRESRLVSNAKVEGKDLAISKTGIVAFVSQGKIAFMDVRSQKSIVTNITGVHPSIHEDIILFSNDELVFGYSTVSGVIARIEKGETPSVFGERAAIVVTDNQEKLIRVVVDNDEDKDDVSDFIDNCPTSSGTSTDVAGDGVGDSCGSKTKPQEKSAAQLTIQNDSLDASQVINKEPPTTNNELAWYWYVLIIAAVVIIGPYAWKFAIHYYKKRKKSFGF